MELEVRKVQQVGYSTLVVSLPREWVKQVGLKQGDVVSLMQDNDGSLRLTPGVSKEGREYIKSVIDGDKIQDEGLLTRIITGVYVVGHDAVQIMARKGLRKDQLEEIRKATQRLTGINIVEQTLNHVTIQNFVDSTKFPVNGLLRRLYIITSSMQDAAFRGLKEGRRDLVNEVLHMENEVDRIYWLVVRQLLLASKDRTIGKKIGVESIQHVVGNRTIAKILENIGDSSEAIAKEVNRMLDMKFSPEDEILVATFDLFELIKGIYDKTINAFFSLDLRLANGMAQTVEEIGNKVDELTEKVFTTIQKRSRGEDGTNLPYYLALRAIIWQLGGIAKYCSTICEITINRYLEQPSEICTFEKT